LITLLSRAFKTHLPLLALLLFAAAVVSAQQAKPKTAPAAPAPPARATESAEAVRRVTPPAQVVTVLHRLSGIKLMRWLHRSGAPVAAIVELENESANDAQMHMSITAGFAVGDGQNIIASLPRAAVEVSASTAATAETLAQSAPSASTAPSADMTIVRPDGSQVTADYVGLDGLTGLSLLRIEGQKLPYAPDAVEEKLAVGQRVRLYAPEPAGKSDAKSSSSLYLRLGEIEGRLATITRSPSGRIAHLTVRAPNLSPSVNGGIAVNDAGETVGIVETSGAGEARILPAQVVRRAAARVLARRSSVPRPLLGVRGKAVTAASLAQLTTGGWSQSEAIALMSKGQGLLLTNVVPNTPAALADLRPGDIILSVNNSEIKSAEDFSSLLSEAGGDDLLFTILRGEKLAPFSRPTVPPFPPLDLSPIARIPTIPAIPPIKLKPFELAGLKKIIPIAVPVNFDFSFKMPLTDFQSLLAPHVRPVPAGPFTARGMETIPLAGGAAARRGARAGVLVISVAASSEAAAAGLREGDVIETVNGRLLSSTARHDTSFAPNADLSLGIVRRGLRLNINLPAKEPKP
jgi:serine protease Do